MTWKREGFGGGGDLVMPVHISFGIIFACADWVGYRINSLVYTPTQRSSIDICTALSAYFYPTTTHPGPRK